MRRIDPPPEPAAFGTILQSTARLPRLSPAELSDLDARVKARDAEERARRRAGVIQALAARMGRRYTPDKATLDTFRVDYQQQRQPVAAVREFVAHGDF